MKQFYLTLLFISLSFFVSAQNNEGTSVNDITIIKRVSNKIETDDNLINKSDLTAKLTTPLFSTPTSPTGNSTEVGITEGQLSVSLTGGATYAIPIEAPPGINGVEPQLSLNYNSHRGLNGTVAVGWDISGVSSITRIPSTKFHDGIIDPVDFDALDRFAIDGQRLIVKTGTNGVYGANKTEYETEYFSNIKVTSYGVHSSGSNYGPAYFLVEYPDGSKAYYGNSVDSQSVMDWSITYWENARGVRINYNYTTLNNVLYIASIKYGSLASAPSVNEIKFVYGSRSYYYTEDSFVGGINVKRNKNLNEIIVIGNGLGFRNYILDAPDRLNSITEKSGDNTKTYNPTTFNYGLSNSQPLKFSELTTSLNVGDINSLNAVTVSGDFDADGKIDYLLYPTTGPEANSKFWLYTNIKSGIDDNIGIGYSVDTFQDIFTTTWLSWNNKVMPQGWTIAKKTNKNYIFTVYGTGISSGVKEQYSKIVNFPLDLVDETCNSTCKITKEEGKIFSKKIISGDFNGDGLTDVIAIDIDTSQRYCTENIQTGRCTTTTETAISKKVYFVDLKRDNTTDFLFNAGQLVTALKKTSKIEVGDFDGDGKSDIFIFDQNYVRIYTINESNKLVLLYQNAIADTGIMVDRPILMGDYNGDGKTDFMIPKAFDSSKWYKYTSTGITLIKEEKNSEIVFSSNNSYNTYNYIPINFNNDNLTDIVRITSFRNQADTSGIITVMCYTNTEGSFYQGPQWSSTGDQSDINIYALPMYLPQSEVISNKGVNQIRSTLEIAFVNQNKMYFFDAKNNVKESNLLTKITTGNGVQEVVTYTSLDPNNYNAYNPIYSPSASISLYPNLDILIDPNVQVVSKIEKQSNTAYKKKSFAYYGAVSNLEGLGFLGFRSTVSTNWYDDSLPIISNISKFDIELRGANTENYTVLGFHEPLITSSDQTAKTIIKENDYSVTGSDNLVATQQIILKPNTWIKSGSTFSAKINPDANTSANAPSDFITKSIMTYKNDLLANKVFKLQNVNTKEYNGLENTNSETKTDYDIYNNPTKSTNIIKEGGNIVQTNIADISYESSSTPYIVGRPTVKNQSTAVTGDVMTSQESYYYNGAQLLHKIEKRGTNTATISEDNVYDNFGNVTKKTITAPGLAPRVTDYQYDLSGRFLTKVIDAERLETAFLNNPNDGTLENTTDAYGITTSYTYDKWFKKLTAKNDKLNKTVSYYYTKNGNQTLFTTKGDASDGSYMEETFDDLGRKIKSGIKDVSGKISYVSYLYDIYDRSYKISEPYFGSTPTQWNETKFDDYGRPKEGILFTGRSSTMQYSGLTTLFTDGLKKKTATKNAVGNTIAMEENTGGTINYNYFANGNLKQTTYNGTNITMEQDGWGRKTKLTDPTAGTFVYDTNDFGELKTEKTQNGGIVTSIERDVTGKPIKKTITGPYTNSETNYEYDPATKLPTVITFTDKLEAPEVNTIITRLTYDPEYKRVVTIVEDKIGYARFTKSFTYDGLGRIDTETKKAEVGNKSSTVATKYKYQNGALYQILDNTTSQVLWQTNALNAKGQILENTIGNGIKMTNEYDSDGYLKKIQHDKTVHPASNIITLTTAFDKNTDNLDSRTNNTFGNWTESFKYDDLERLTEFTNSSGQQETQNYESSGKIKDNSLGTYNYDVTTKPYQNTSITLTPEALGYYTGREGIYSESMESRMGWSRGAHNPQCVSFDNTMAHTGQNSLRINTTGVTVSYVQSDVSIPINNTTDTEYTFSGWVYSDSPIAQLTFFMHEEETGAYTNYKSSNTSTLNQWVHIKETFLVPANIRSLSLRLDNVGTGNVWFDDIQIRKTSNTATQERKLIVDYNAFKSPVKIEETGVDKINFSYNDDNQRSTMFYGGFEDKLLRPYRKHYAADGTMEIKENRITNTLEFVTYIGGDGYSAPIVAKSDGNNIPNYLYLHRDYQSSIMAITDAAGIVIEKRLYDAWGKISKVQDGAGNNLPGLTVLDRGYTGHEHLQSVGLINMNARLYDPMLHRFLSVDNYIQVPTSTQNYNQYGYVMNNPLKYTDPSGNTAKGNGGDCKGCGQIGIGPGDQTGSGFDIEKFAKDYGIDKWAKKNLNFNSWGRSWNKFWGKNRNSGPPPPPPNMSTYVNMNTTGGGQYYGGNGSGNFMDYFSRFVYETDQFNPIALAWDGIKGNFTGSDRYGNNLSGFESNLKIVSAIPMTKVAGAFVNSSIKSIALYEGKTFAQYKIAQGGTETLDFIKTTNASGQIVNQRISTEFHHLFITQRMQRGYGLPNWLVNNRLNVVKLNTIQHSLVDPHRFKFLRAGLKPEVGWFGEYNWFTKFPQ